MRKNLTPEQQAASEERKARLRALSKKVSDMTPEQRAEIAAKMATVVTCEGRALSPFNACMIWTQNPDCTIVGGFRQWLKQGRAVAKGQHGYSIWVPCKPRGERADDLPADGEKSERRQGFILGTVFDVSQTIEIQTGVAA